jgi:hypothetical protein
MNIPIWPGSSSFAAYSASYYNTPSTGSSPTPFGFYDSDTQFKTDADKVANFCARRLGYPLTDIELQDINFWAAFEEAITTYGNELYAYRVRDNMLSLEGAPTNSSLNNAIITPNMATIIRLAQQYAAEAGAGGNITWYSGSVALTSSIQDYDLNKWAIQNNITGGIEIKQVFYQAPPAVNQLYAPWGGFGGLGGVPASGFYGGGFFGGGIYGTGYLMMPVAYDVATIQGIELSNQIRMANYTFEIINNMLRIWPIPGDSDDYRGGYLWFRYIKSTERYTDSIDQVGTGSITNVSNAPYNNPVYQQINAVGRQWVFEYTLALAKEMLGYVRGKYSVIPIPDQNITLNQSDLLSAATAEKQALIERLRAYFDETSKKALLERRKDESDFLRQEISNVPMVIYIG